jgi:Trk K+ transport system NAD-binding subunit
VRQMDRVKKVNIYEVTAQVENIKGKKHVDFVFFAVTPEEVISDSRLRELAETKLLQRGHRIIKIFDTVRLCTPRPNDTVYLVETVKPSLWERIKRLF